MFSLKGWLFLSIAVVCTALMNVAMKSLASYSTYWIYVIATGIGFLLSVAGYFFFSRTGGGDIDFNRWMVVLGIAVAFLNFSFVRIYQEGGSVAFVPLVVTALTTIVLTLVGVSYFQEVVSWQQYIGMGVVIAGMALMVI